MTPRSKDLYLASLVCFVPHLTREWASTLGAFLLFAGWWFAYKEASK